MIAGVACGVLVFVIVVIVIVAVFKKRYFRLSFVNLLHTSLCLLNSSPNLISTSLIPLVVFDMLALPFGIHSLIIYRLLYCLQIQSKNLHFLWCKHLWPLAISINALLIIMLIFAS